MKVFYAVVFCALAASAVAEQQHWALLIAGSNTWANYRHQADVCHSFQIVKAAGVPEERIVTFIYDDLANDPSNPLPGKVINKPNGSDVYGGVKIDYKGADITPDNVIAALQGNSSALTLSRSDSTGRVIDSAADDHVFVYYADHGGPGILGMPTGQPFLYADKINAALKAKKSANGFKEMTFYIEACESGSIFDGTLPDDIAVYGVTASNPSQSSWGYYCPGMKEYDPRFNTCLGDLFSISWLEDTDAHDVTVETLKEQYKSVKTRTANPDNPQEGSQVMQYGSKSLQQKHLVSFVGQKSSTAEERAIDAAERIESNAVSSRDVTLMYLYNVYMAAAEGTPEKAAALASLAAEVEQRATIDANIEQLVTTIAGAEQLEFVQTHAATPVVDDWDCLREMVDTYERSCGAISSYGYKHTRSFANMCNMGVDMKLVRSTIGQMC